MISSQPLESSTASQINNYGDNSYVPRAGVHFSSIAQTDATVAPVVSNTGRFTNSLRHQIRGRQHPVPNLNRSRLLISLGLQNSYTGRSIRNFRHLSAPESLANDGSAALSNPTNRSLGNNNTVPIGDGSGSGDADNNAVGGNQHENGTIFEKGYKRTINALSDNAIASGKIGGGIGSIMLRRRRHSDGVASSSSSMKFKVKSIFAQGKKSPRIIRRSKKKKIGLPSAVSPGLASTRLKPEIPSTNLPSATGKKKTSSSSAAVKAKIKNARMFNDATIYLDGPQIYTCAHCRTHLTSHDDIISKSFHGRHGRAYLLDQCVNVTAGPAEDRMLMTGLHSVTDLFCKRCKNKIGWSYEKCYKESQKYKEGKFIIEKINLYLEEQSHYDKDIEPPAGERYDKWKRRSMGWGSSRSKRRDNCRYNDGASVFRGREEEGRTRPSSLVHFDSTTSPRNGSSSNGNNIIYEYRPQQTPHSTGIVGANHVLPSSLLPAFRDQQNEAFF